MTIKWLDESEENPSAGKSGSSSIRWIDQPEMLDTKPRYIGNPAKQAAAGVSSGYIQLSSQLGAGSLEMGFEKEKMLGQERISKLQKEIDFAERRLAEGKTSSVEAQRKQHVPLFRSLFTSNEEFTRRSHQAQRDFENAPIKDLKAEKARLAELKNELSVEEGMISYYEENAQDWRNIRKQMEKASVSGWMEPPENMTTSEWVVRTVSQALPSAGAAYAMAPVSPVTGAMLLGHVEGISTFMEAKNKGLSTEEAYRIYQVEAALASALEKLPLDEAQKLNRIKGLKGAAFVKFITQGSAEAGQEVTQEMTSNKIAQFTYDPERGLMDNTGAAAVGGFGAGSLAAVTQHVGQRQQESIVNKHLDADQEVRDWARKNPGQAFYVALKENPSRKDFKDAGLPKAGKNERARLASVIKEQIGAEFLDKAKKEMGVEPKEEPKPEPKKEEPKVEPPASVQEAKGAVSTRWQDGAQVVEQGINTMPVDDALIALDAAEENIRRNAPESERDMLLKKAQERRKGLEKDKRHKQIAQNKGRQFFDVNGWLADDFGDDGWGHVVGGDVLVKVAVDGDGQLDPAYNLDDQGVFVNRGPGQAARIRLQNKGGMAPLVFSDGKLKARGVSPRRGAEAVIETKLPLADLNTEAKMRSVDVIFNEMDYQGREITDGVVKKVAENLGLAESVVRARVNPLAQTAKAEAPVQPISTETPAPEAKTTANVEADWSQLSDEDIDAISDQVEGPKEQQKKSKGVKTSRSKHALETSKAINVAKKHASKSKDRAVFNGVYLDQENQVAVSTDGGQIIVIPTKVDGESRIVATRKIEDYNPGDLIDRTYPNWQAVIPQDNRVEGELDVQASLQNMTKRIDDLKARVKSKEIKKSNAIATVWLKGKQNRQTIADAVNIRQALKSLSASGAKHITFSMNKDDAEMSPVMLEGDNGAKAVVMPVRINDDTKNAPTSDDNALVYRDTSSSTEKSKNKIGRKGVKKKTAIESIESPGLRYERAFREHLQSGRPSFDIDRGNLSETEAKNIRSRVRREVTDAAASTADKKTSEIKGVDHGSEKLNKAAAALADAFKDSAEEFNFPSASDSDSSFDEAVYAKAKPAFDMAREDIMGKGGSFIDFAKWVHSLDLGDLRSYLKRYRNDLAGEKDQKQATFQDEARDIILSQEDAGRKNRRMKAIAEKYDLKEKVAQERIEAILVDIGRKIANRSDLSEQDRFYKLIELYENQPRFSKRTSTSMRDQAYSTPLPLAFAVNLMAGIDSNTTLYEPTAGHGALALLADPGNTHVNELNESRRSELAARDYAQVTGHDASRYTPYSGYDRVVANPPFGSLDLPQNIESFQIKRLEHLISIKALDAMNDDGSAALILGAGMHVGATTASDKIFLNYLMNNYNVVGNFEVDGSLYAAQGASFPVRIVTISGRKKESTGMQKLAPESVPRVATWGDVWNNIKEVRHETAKLRQNMESAGRGQRGSSDNSDSGSTATEDTGRRSSSTSNDGRTNGKRSKRGRRTDGRKQFVGKGTRSGTDGPVDGSKTATATTDGVRSDGRGESTGVEVVDPSSTQEARTDQQGRDSSASDQRFEPSDLDRQDVDLNIREGREATDRQNYYDSSSKGFSLKTLVNKLLSPGTYRALARIEKRVGDIDKWTAEQLGYKTVAEMHEGLAGEQVDGVALAIDKIQQGGALIIGDQTGIGKGRQAAAIMRYAKHQGWMPVFITKDGKLFSDMNDDAGAIGESFTPFILGDPKTAHIRDSDDNILQKAMTPAMQRRTAESAVAGDSIREDYDSVFMTYSQLKDLEKGTGALNPRHKFLNHLAQADQVLLVLDESHEGAGLESNTGLFLRGGSVRKKVSGSWVDLNFPGLLNQPGVKGATYLSATYAKRPDTMPLYFKTSLGKAVRDIMRLPEIFQKGGLAMQQAVANALAQSGEYVRRERDFSGVNFVTKSTIEDEAAKQKMITDMDDTTSVLREIVQFSHDVVEIVGDNPDLVPTVNLESGLAANEFSSVLHNYIGQLLLALKADAAVNEAKAAYARGEAPVLALSNTMGAFIEGYAQENGLERGDRMGLTFADILQRALDRTMRVSEDDGGGNTTVHTLSPEQLGLEKEYNVIVEMINELNNDIPASPIDKIRFELEKEGMKVRELTGREHVIDYQENGDAIYRRRSTNERKNKNAHVNAFNTGKADVIILNKSGSTGLSLHASTKNPKAGQKPRHMIVVQADLDINTFTQTLGRILRTGMVGLPSTHAMYTLLTIPVEAERRPATVLAAKMKSLNANTTADTDSDTDVETVDFFNKYGDKVVAELLADDLDLQVEVGMSVSLDEDGNPMSDEAGMAKKLTGRIAVLPNSRQQAIYEQIHEAYKDLIQELKESGAYDLEVDQQAGWDARLIEEEVLEEGTDERSMFTSSLNLRKYSVKDTRKPPTAEDLRKSWKERYNTDDPIEVKKAVRAEVDKLIADLSEQADVYVGEEPVVDKEDKASQQAHNQWKARVERVNSMKERVETMLDMLADTAGSKLYHVGEDNQSNTGYLIDLEYKKGERGNPYRLSRFRATLMIESRQRKLRLSFPKLVKPGVVLNQDLDVNGIDGFAAHLNPDERVEVRVMTGNLVKAMEAADAGMVTTFGTSKGESVTGLVLPASWKEGSMSGGDPRLLIKSGAAAIRLLQDRHGSRIEGRVDNITIGKAYDGSFTITVPRARSAGGKIFLDKKLTKITGDFESSGRKMKVSRLNEKQITKAADHIINNLKVDLQGDGVQLEDIKAANKNDEFGYPSAAGEQSRPGRGIGATRQDGAKIEQVKPVQPTKIVDTIKKLWPGLSVRGRATWTSRKNPGWYNRSLGEMRLLNAGDIIAAVHELGHHFDRQMGMWSKTMDVPKEIRKELLTLGKELYGKRRPKGGYRAEGFAEFIGQYISGTDIRDRAPYLYDWFTTEYLITRPKEAAKLRELEDVMAQFQIQTPQQAIDALLSPRRADWSGERIAAKLADFESKQIDAFMPLLRGMRKTGADLSKLKPTQDPYMQAIYFARSSGGRALNAMLSHSVDLYGRENGESLRSIFAPAVDAGKSDDVFRYWIAKRIATRYHAHDLPSGLSIEDAQTIIREHQSPMFDEIVEKATEWSHKQLHLLVEAGVISESKFKEIVDMNPIYAPMMRQFMESEKRNKGKGKGGKGIYKVKGGQQPIENPLSALAQQTARLHQVAMQHSVLRSMVQFYDSHKGKSESMGKFMSEVAAPKERIDFSMEKIKDAVGKKALEMGAEEDAVMTAMLETWDDMLTIFRPRKDYRGSDNVIAIEIADETRFFEINADMLPILEGVTQSRFLGEGAVAKLFSGATSLQRLGATGLNPEFGLLRNPTRDTLTASVTSEYHFHIPVISTITGSLMDIANSEYAQMYHGAGLDIAGRVGQDQRSARKAGQRVTAKGHVQSIARAGVLDGVREILGHSEVGPRLMEFRGAYNHAMKQDGWTDADAMVLAGCASKDVTVNFSRAGSDGRQVNELVLFYNAAFQSIDKFARAFGARKALPWAKSKSRAANLSRTMAKGAGFLTLAALMNYYRNRDEEWWKELPSYEKWNYIHIAGLNGEVIARIPLPFEMGSIFAALPIALIENKRKPGAFYDALKIAFENATPVDTGLDEKDFMRKVAALMRNVALFGPIADILINEDWKGSKIVPRYLQYKLPKDQFTHDTSSMGKLIGQYTPGLAPAQIDHLLNSYTSGLYKRITKWIETAGDPSAVNMSDPSSIPIAGTLFLKPGTSEIIGKFYDRLDHLQQLKSSNEASVAEIGELSEAGRLSRKLSKMWSERRKIMSSDQKAGNIKRETNKLQKELLDVIREYQSSKKPDYARIGAGILLYAATSPKADQNDRSEVRRLLAGMSRQERIKALQRGVRRRGGKIVVRTSTGRLTAYGLRLMRLKKIEEQE